MVGSFTRKVLVADSKALSAPSIAGTECDAPVVPFNQALTWCAKLDRECAFERIYQPVSSLFDLKQSFGIRGVYGTTCRFEVGA